MSSFVGRERETAGVEGLLGHTRLVTLTGPGGCGKTRLGLAVAADLAAEFDDGVWLVELASLSDPALVPQTVAAALGVREQPGRALSAALIDYLRPKQLLLVLDNCEHLVGACAGLADTLLASCPRLRILATGRQALGITGEACWQVPTLSVPEEGQALSLEQVAEYEAVRLFVERASLRLPGFELTSHNAGAVAQTCRRLDGIPLAIELAAARVTALAVEQIADRLEDCLALLTAGSPAASPRQRTLRATLAWSHELLGERERRLFRRLAVFAGGWTLEAAEAVGPGGGIRRADVVELLSRLVDKSLVVADSGSQGAARYSMLEPIRQYGREALGCSGEAEAVRGHHADWFLALAERAAPQLKTPQQVAWLGRLAQEDNNLRAALEWLLGRGQLVEASRLAWALWLFWWIRGRFAEGRRWMQQALDKGAAMPAAARAKVLFVAGTMADGQADYRSAESLLGESLGLFKQLGDRRGAAYALSSAGFAAIGQGRNRQGIAVLEEAVELALAEGERWAAAFMLCFLATARRNEGDRTGAQQLAERGLALSEEVGDREGACAALYILATLAQESESDGGRAGRLLGEALARAAEVGDQTNVAYCLDGLAAVAGEQGRLARAGRLWGAAEALLEQIEAAAYVYAPDRVLCRDRVAPARLRLGVEAFEAAWAQGRAMTPGQAVAYALGQAATEQDAGAPDAQAASGGVVQDSAAYPDGLTAREAEVLRLLAGGNTNKEIAAQLVLSVATVQRHVANLYRKIGARGRADATAYALKRGLAQA
ncbi:MAG: LuxR C-terminal-related transcriptional regulator [Actinomycetota bacterium]|nr:LuxR C-terminal-related transcriptional regulator [Actinomycetota bacterium]